MRVSFVRLSHFLVDYIQFAAVLKVLYQIVIACPWVENAVAYYDQGIQVQILKALFGHEHLKFGTFKEWRWTILYEISLLGSFFFANSWKISKAIQQRSFTQHFEESATDDERFEAVAKKENLITLKLRRRRFVDIYNRGKAEADQMETGKLDVDSLSAYKDGFESSSYAPVIIVWALRFAIGLQAYMYHSLIGQVHLTWILLSFIFSIQTTLWLSTIFMVPIYTIEFVIVYGCQLRVIQDVSVFKHYGQYFQTEMKRPILE